MGEEDWEFRVSRGQATWGLRHSEDLREAANTHLGPEIRRGVTRVWGEFRRRKACGKFL